MGNFNSAEVSLVSPNQCFSAPLHLCASAVKSLSPTICVLALAALALLPLFAAQETNLIPAEFTPKAASLETNLLVSVKALVGSEWQLKQLGGETVPADSLASLAFAADGVITGHGGVNRFRGIIIVRDATVKVGPLMATKMAGPPALNALEAKYLQTLGAATRFVAEGDTLRVTIPGEDKSLIFSKKTAP